MGKKLGCFVRCLFTNCRKNKTIPRRMPRPGSRLKCGKNGRDSDAVAAFSRKIHCDKKYDGNRSNQCSKRTTKIWATTERKFTNVFASRTEIGSIATLELPVHDNEPRNVQNSIVFQPARKHTKCDMTSSICPAPRIQGVLDLHISMSHRKILDTARKNLTLIEQVLSSEVKVAN